MTCSVDLDVPSAWQEQSGACEAEHFAQAICNAAM